MKPDEIPGQEAAKLAEDFEDDLGELRENLREAVVRVDDEQAKALFETAAETLDGLQGAFTDYRAKNEEAWRPAAPVMGH